MVATLEQKRQWRLQFINLLYQLAGGARFKPVDLNTIGNELQLRWSDTLEVEMYLIEEGLVDPFGAGPLVQLTHKGIVEVEASQQHPDQPTEHFPAARTVNIIHVAGNMVGSEVQQAGEHSQQTADFVNASEATTLGEFVRLVGNRLETLELPSDDLDDMKAQLQTIQAQLGSPRPRRHLILESLAVIKGSLDAIASAVTVAPPAVAAAQFLLANFPHL